MSNIAASPATAHETERGSRHPRRLPPALLDPLILLALVLSFFWKLVFTKQYSLLASPDISQQVLPWLQAQVTALQQYHTIAFWDPFEFFGQSLIGQVQPAVVSPFTFLLALAPMHHGHINIQIFNFWFAFIHFCGALFAWFFLRDLGVSRAASIVGALFYTLAGYVGTTEWPQMLSGAIWGPLVFMFLLRSLRGRRPLASAAFAGLFLGCSWLSGHHQPPLYLSLAAISVPIYLLCRNRDMRMQIVVRSAVFLAVTGLIAAIQMLPAEEYARLSVRWTMTGVLNWNQKVGVPEHEAFSFKPADLAHVILPGGGVNIDPIAGVAGVMLATLAIMTMFQRMEVRVFTAIGLAALLLSMARNDVLYGLFYTFVPLIEKSRTPARMLSVVQLCVAVLVGFGADVFLSRVRVSLLTRAARWLGIFALVTFSLWFLVQFLKPTINSIVEGDDRPLMVGFIAALLAALVSVYARGLLTRRTAAVCLTLLMMIELGNSEGYYFAHHSEEKRWAFINALSDGDEIADYLRRQPKPLRASVNRDDLTVNFGDWYGIESVESYLASMATETLELNWWPHRIVSMFGVGYTISKKQPADLHEVVFTAHNGIRVFRNPDAFPRAWTAHNFVPVKDEAAALKLVRDGTIDLRANAVIVSRPPAIETCAEPDIVSPVRESIQIADVDVTMSCRGVLMLGDNWYPGWTVSVDGSSRELLRVNSAIRGVVLDKGKHHVRFAYRPASIYAGFTGMLFGIAILIFLARRPELEGDDLFRESE